MELITTSTTSSEPINLAEITRKKRKVGTCWGYWFELEKRLTL